MSAPTIEQVNTFPCPACGANPGEWCSELPGAYLTYLPKDSTPWCHTYRRKVMEFNVIQQERTLTLLRDS